MTENEVQPDPEKTPPAFEVEQSDDYSKFLLYSRSEVLAVLRSLIQKGSMITVHFDQGKSFLLTSMIGLTADNKQFLLDLGSNDEMNRRALQAKKLFFTALVEKVKIQFSLNKLTESTSGGRPVFAGAIPETLLRLQRREYYRLSTPIASPIKLSATLYREDGSALAFEAPLLDISGGGVGLMVTTEQASLLQRSDELKNCKMNLPDEGELIANLCVRNMFEVTTRTGSRYMRIGCEFINLPGPKLTLVQRYITRVERERKARMSGMA